MWTCIWLLLSMCFKIIKAWKHILYSLPGHRRSVFEREWAISHHKCSMRVGGCHMFSNNWFQDMPVPSRYFLSPFPEQGWLNEVQTIAYQATTISQISEILNFIATALWLKVDWKYLQVPSSLTYCYLHIRRSTYLIHDL